MGLFSKKLDFDKNSLTIKFDLDTKKYQMYEWNKLVPVKKLNKESIKKLNEYNDKLNDENLLNQEIEIAEANRKQALNIEARREKLNQLGYNAVSFKTLGFEPGSVSQELLDYLLPILTEENVLVGIHRTGMANMKDINNIFEKGFLMTGHGLNVIQTGGVPLNENFGYYPNNMEILNQLKYAGGYKSSKGSILIRIPDEDLKDGKFFEEDKTMDSVSRIEDGKVIEKPVERITRHIKTEYILGYVPVSEDFSIDRIILNPNYNKKTENKEGKIDIKAESIANEIVEKMAMGNTEFDEEVKSK